MGTKSLRQPDASRSQKAGDVGNSVLAQVSQCVWTCLTHRTVLKAQCAAHVAPFPLQDPHLAAQIPLFISLHRESKAPLLSETQWGFLCPGWGSGKVCFVQRLPLPTLPAPETLSERRKIHSKRLPKYQSAVQSPGEERFSSPAEAAVNKHDTCFISCQGCPLLSTDLTWAPRQKRRQEPESPSATNRSTLF